MTSPLSAHPANVFPSWARETTGMDAQLILTVMLFVVAAVAVR
jgi:hypothetical protein